MEGDGLDVEGSSPVRGRGRLKLHDDNSVED